MIRQFIAKVFGKLLSEFETEKEKAPKKPNWYTKLYRHLYWAIRLLRKQCIPLFVYLFILMLLAIIGINVTSCASLNCVVSL